MSVLLLFTFPPDKCPSTRVLPSQLNPSSTVINHLLLGRMPRGSRYAPTATSMLPGSRPISLAQRQSSPARHCCDSLPSNSTRSPWSSGGGAGSPWRTHVRVYRRNVARARAQLGFGDSEENEHEEDGGSAGGGVMIEQEQKDRRDSSVCPSPDPSVKGSVSEEVPQVLDKTRETNVGEVVVQLETLGLDDINQDTKASLAESKPEPQVPLLPPPPSSSRQKEPDSSGSEQNDSPDGHFPTTIALNPPHPSTGMPSSSPSPSVSPFPTSAALEPPSLSSPTPPSSPALSSCHSPSPPANDLSSPLTLSPFYKTSSPSTPSISSYASSSQSHMSVSTSTPAFLSTSAVTPKQQVFSPFPSVKQPRRSVAARNLGLYGPTSRTPTVHFPHLSRNLNRSSGTGTTGRR